MTPQEQTRFMEIKRSGRLPSPGGVALEVLRLTAQADVAGRDLERAISADPALTGRIIAYANSPLLSAGKPARSVADAVPRLGVAALRQLVLGFALVHTTRRGGCPGFDYELYWARSLADAACARLMARHLQVAPDDLFTCGLLAGVGRLALASVFPEAYGRIIASTAGQGDAALVQAEREILAADHRALACLMMKDWGLPAALAEAAERAPAMDRAPELPRSAGERVAGTLRMGLSLADCLCAEQSGERHQRGLQLPADCDGPALVEEAREAWHELCGILEIDPARGEDLVRAPRVMPVGAIVEAPPLGLMALLVSSDPATRSATAEACLANSFGLACVPDGPAMLESVVSAPPQVLLVEGFEQSPALVRQLAGLRASDMGRRIHVIALTGPSGPGESINDHCDDWVPSPVSARMLSTRLRIAQRFAALRLEVEEEREESRRALGELAVANRKLEQAVITDNLTGLPNRLLFNDRLAQALITARREHERVAVMFMDLDRFKQVNDSLGHKAGDAMLQQFASRVRACVKESDTLARMSGDEFTLVTPNISNPDDSLVIARRIHDALASPFRIHGSAVPVEASIGIAVFPEHGQDPEELARHADAAMYTAKRSGRGRTVLYRPEIGAAAERRVKIEAVLREAIRDGAFRVAYQPQFALSNGRLMGVEALLRLSDPELGDISPAEFVPVAEESGLIIPIGEWVLRTAAAQGARWNRGAFPNLAMAVNLSAKQFADPDMIGMVQDVLSVTGLPAKLLHVEVTESVLMENLSRAAETLSRLAGLGVAIWLDDFGTGYSSLGYLRDLPIGGIKIDRSFVAGVPNDAYGSELVQSVIGMASRMKLMVVGEGVETKAQLDFLRKAGCTLAQGYLLAKPTTAEEVEARFASSRGLATTPRKADPVANHP